MTVLSLNTLLWAGQSAHWTVHWIGQVAIAMLESTNFPATPSLPRSAFEGNVIWITGSMS